MKHRAPKQGRSEETFHKILAAAATLFSEQGRTNIPIREICEESGASKSSFYARFPSLETLIRVSYDQFSTRVLEVIDDVTFRWGADRPGGDDFEAFVHNLIDSYARFFETERRLLQAFRSAERADPELAERRLRLEREILSRSIRSACHHYRWIDREEIEATLDQGIGIIAGAARGIFDFSDQLSIASELSRDDLVDQLVALVLRFVPSRRVNAPMSSDVSVSATP